MTHETLQTRRAQRPDRVASGPPLTGTSAAADRLSRTPRMTAQRQVARRLFGKSVGGPVSVPPIQRYTGPIPEDGLDRKAVQAMIKEAETTKFDMRGHAVRKHGGHVTDEEKATRRNIPMDSSFDSNGLITRTLQRALDVHQATINSWLESTSDKNLVCKVDMSDVVEDHEGQLGSGMRRIAGGQREKVEGLVEATVIFRKAEVPDRKNRHQRARDTEWHLLTAFPSE